MPDPSSSTMSRAASPTGSTVIVISDPAGEYLAALDTRLVKIRSSLSEDISAVSEADALAKFRNFHLFLLEATKNQLLVVAAAPIFTVLQSTIVRRRPTKEVIAEIELDHQKIYEAVEARDEVAARRLMDEHLGFLRANYQPGINSTEGFDQPKQPKRTR